MLKIYGNPMSTCTRKVLMTLAENGTPFEMNVVDFLHPGDSEDGAGYVFHAHTLRTAFQQNMRRLPQNSDAGPQHQ